MADEQNPNNTDTTTQPAAPATQPAATSTPAFTQADIDAAREQAKNAAWAEARRTFEKKQQASGGTQATPSNTAQTAPVDPLAILKLRDDFDDATSDLTLNSDQKKFLRNLVMEKRPDNVGEYVTSFVKAWGASKPATPATPAPETPAPKTTPQGPPVTGSGAPANPTHTVTEDTPILRMSDSDKIALRRKIGDVAFVERMRKEFKDGNVRVKFK